MKVKIKGIRLTKSQEQAYRLIKNKNTKFLTLNWSRQSGKSTLMKLLCVEWLLSKKKNVGYVTRNYILSKTLFSDLTKLLPKQVIKTSNASDLTIETITGSKLRFFSAESGDSLRGQSFTNLICDEFAFFPKLKDFYFDVLSPTVKVNGEKVIFVSTPFGKNLFYDFYMKGLEEDTEFASLKKTIYDDGLISEEEILNIRQLIPLRTFEQEYLCEFLDDGASFFEGYDKCFKDEPFDDTSEKYIGIDLSANGTDKTILTIINKKHQVAQYQIDGTLDVKYYKIAEQLNTLKNVKTAYIETNGIGAVMLNEIKKLTNRKNIIHEHLTTNKTKLEEASDLALLFLKGDIVIPTENDLLRQQLADFQMAFSNSGKQILKGRGNTHDDNVLSLMIATQAMKDSNKKGNYYLSFN